ncbi:MAG: acetyl-CoA carboxylase carboxyltransferase subunit beta [Simkaniaceae bacterium]|nr:acetyl-CoA carboxylase carboxyltransferase subunit beta [Simkaniaceae bacterium]
MRLFSRHKPKIKGKSTKSDSFSGWVKCTSCEEMVHTHELKDNYNCCPKCNYHCRISATERVAMLSDEGTFQELFTEIHGTDPLEFVDSQPYIDRMKKAKEKSNRSEAVIAGTCLLEKQKVALAVLDFSFMGGSMGSVVGERLTLLIEHAISHSLPLIIVSSSGGARMQESIFSLMQMAKTAAALAKMHNAKLPYISILTNPTTGGVTASFASLGDIIIAEPDALIGFAGPRVVEQTIREKLPESAQKSEFLLEKGMIDCITERRELKAKTAFFVQFLTGNARAKQDLPGSMSEKDSPFLNSSSKLDDLIAASKKEREKNRIHVLSEVE